MGAAMKHAMQRSLLVAGLVLMLGGFAHAVTKYGMAVVEQGSMTIVRDGKSNNFAVSPNPVEILEKDLVRVRDNSRVLLTTADKATVTLGANAIFQVEPWQSNEKQGVFRMLFGRFRASVNGLSSTDRFNVKTATAVIGVKGTEYVSAVTVGGYTAVMGVHNVTTNEGSDGVEQPVTPNTVSITASPATKAVPAPPEFAVEMQSVNAPRPGSPAAVVFPAMTALVQAGIVSPTAADKWTKEREGGDTSTLPTSNTSGGQASTTSTSTTTVVPLVIPVIPNLIDAQQAKNKAKGSFKTDFGN